MSACSHGPIPYFFAVCVVGIVFSSRHLGMDEASTKGGVLAFTTSEVENGMLEGDRSSRKLPGHFPALENTAPLMHDRSRMAFLSCRLSQLYQFMFLLHWTLR
jgi:hypothetical protein